MGRRPDIHRYRGGVDLYTRRDGVVRGPYTAEQVTRYILLGRIRLKDELSRDRAGWSPVPEYSNLLPEEILSLENWTDYQRLIEARLRIDERRGERRLVDDPRDAGCHEERRSGSDRRVNRESFPDEICTNGGMPGRRAAEGNTSLLRTLLLGLLLATLIFAWLVQVER